MPKRILIIFFICAFFLGGFVLAFNLHAASTAEVLTSEDLPSAVIVPETTSPAAEKTMSAPPLEKTTAVQKTQSPQEKPTATSKPMKKTSAAAVKTIAPPEPVAPAESLINIDGQTLAERIGTPDGFARIECAEGSFGAFMRSYELKEHGTPVYFYDGRQKTGAKHIAVFDMFLGYRDLQQCADSIMRIIAEYYFAAQQYEKISFDFVSGFECRYDKWIEGYRVGFEGNNAFWKAGGSKGASGESLKAI